MAYWLGNGVDRWYDIYLETRLLGRQSIDQPRFQARAPNCLFTSELKKQRSRLSENEKAEFLTKTERKKCKNKHNTLRDGCYLLFE